TVCPCLAKLRARLRPITARPNTPMSAVAPAASGLSASIHRTSLPSRWKDRHRTRAAPTAAQHPCCLLAPSREEQTSRPSGLANRLIKPNRARACPHQLGLLVAIDIPCFLIFAGMEASGGLPH